jgi:hypothetical protein
MVRNEWIYTPTHPCLHGTDRNKFNDRLFLVSVKHYMLLISGLMFNGSILLGMSGSIQLLPLFFRGTEGEYYLHKSN